MNRVGRVLFALTAVAIIAVLGIARWVEPDERGFGTHEQLGLPPCSFRALTGVPCPSCGMTTSFAYVMRGRLIRATVANPGGCLLALGAVALIPWCLASAVSGRALGIRAPERATLIAVLAVFGLSIAGWIVRFLF